MRKRGQVFTGIFTWVLVGMLLFIAVTTVVLIIYYKSQPNVVYIYDNTTNDTITANGTPIPTPPIETPPIETPPIINVTPNISVTINVSTNNSIANASPLLVNQSINQSNTTIPENTIIIPTNCSWSSTYPDYDCTPGVVMTKNKTLVCTPGYATSVRNVSQTTKNKVYEIYGITTHTSGEWQVDHLIPLSLGGSNDIRNLWPEPSTPYPGYYQKDKVERYLYQQVCDNKMDLETAQVEIAHNWNAYISSSSNTIVPADYDTDVAGDQIIG